MGDAADIISKTAVIKMLCENKSFYREDALKGWSNYAEAFSGAVVPSVIGPRLGEETEESFPLINFRFTLKLCESV